MEKQTFKIARALLMVMPLLQLALSEIHIAMITRLFVRDVGFYLFLYIIMGLLVLFNLTSMKTSMKGHLTKFIFSVIVTVVSGCLVIYKTWMDYGSQESVTFDTIKYSIALIVISLVVYVIGSIVIVVIGSREKATKVYA